MRRAWAYLVALNALRGHGGLDSQAFVAAPNILAGAPWMTKHWGSGCVFS
jgi:hypothetical protein